MAFNPDPNKQATEVIFPTKPSLLITTVIFQWCSSSFFADSKTPGTISFDHHLNEKVSKAYPL